MKATRKTEINVSYNVYIHYRIYRFLQSAKDKVSTINNLELIMI